MTGRQRRRLSALLVRYGNACVDSGRAVDWQRSTMYSQRADKYLKSIERCVADIEREAIESVAGGVAGSKP